MSHNLDHIAQQRKATTSTLTVDQIAAQFGATEAANLSTASSLKDLSNKIGGIRTPSASASRPTIFKRELKTTHATLGSKIIDTPISSIFSDVFDGQAKFFPALENAADGSILSEGSIPIGGTLASANYLAEFPVLDTPSFGSAELIGIDLNIYHDNINFNFENQLPDIEIYKFKRTLSTQGDFGLPILDADGKGSKVYVASSTWDNVSYMSEIFDGSGTAIAGDIPNTTNTQTHATSRDGLYMTLDDAWTINDCSECKSWVTRAGGINSKGAFRKTYATLYNGQWIIYMVPCPYNKAYYRPNKDNPRLMRRNFAVDRGRYDYEYAEAKGMTKFKWQAFHYTNQSTTSAASVQDLDEAKITTDNTAFDVIRYSPPILNNDDANEKKFIYNAISLPYFSNLNTPPSGQCLALSAFIDHTNVAATVDFPFGTSEIPYQSMMTMLRVPKPQRLSRKHSNSDASGAEDQMDALTVDIKFSILEMSKYHRSNKTDVGSDIGGHNLLRGFFVMFGTRAPHQSENFADYIYYMNETNDNTGRNNLTYQPTGLLKNQYNGIGFIRHTVTENNATVQEGDIKVTTSNKSTARSGDHTTNGWEVTDGSPGPSPGAAAFPHRPFILKAAGTGVVDTTNYLHEIGTEEGAPFDLGTWYTLRAMIYQDGAASNPDDGEILWMVLDGDGNIVFEHKQKHVGNDFGTGAGETAAEIFDNRFHGFPSYLTFWVNNARVGTEGEPTDGSGLYDNANNDTSVKVVIDSVNIYGVENKTHNATAGERNNSRGVVLIDAETDMPLTNFTATQVVRSPPVTFGGADKISVPTYISWGFNEDIITNKTNNFFLGDFSASNPLFNNITDTDKSSLFVKTTDAEEHDTDITFYLPEADTPLGMWHVEGRFVNVDKVPNINDHVTLTGINNVDHFTKKGFFTIDNTVIGSGSYDFPAAKYVKRENPAVATKITDVSQAASGILKVKNPEVLKGFRDDEFIIYRAGYAVDFASTTGNTKYLKGITMKTSDMEGESISFQGASGISILNADSGAVLCHKDFLHELYISPYKYWVMCEIYNVAENDRKSFLPSKSYGYSLVQKGTPPQDVTRGMTFDEFTYSDTSANSFRWNVAKVSDDGLIEDSVDYGFGATNSSNEGAFVSFDGESGVGYIQKYVPELGYNAVSIDGLVNVEGGRLIRPNERINLFIKPAESVSGSCALHTTKSDETAGDRRPYLVFYYADAQPTIGSFSVKPSEADPFYPTYTWDVSGDDLWYGFLMLSASNSSTVKVGGSAIVGTSEIKHQYEGAVAHIPLNETATDQYYLYRYDGTNGGTAVASFAVGKNNLTTIEGLAGNALKTNGGDGTGGDDSYVTWKDATYTQPDNQFSMVAHFTCDSIAATRYIIDKKNEFSLYIDTSGNVNATLEPDVGTAVTLKSATLVNTDGQTPMNVILTFDYSLATGNVKLFINGKLEDQTGVKTTAGSANNWKIGQRMNNHAVAGAESELMIGAQNTSTGDYTSFGGTTRRAVNDHSGTIEEVVLYNQAIYPVIPQTGEATIYKAVPELTMGDPQAGISNTARLFVKDYHNIRGTLASEVAASSAVSYRKSGLGLKSVV